MSMNKHDSSQMAEFLGVADSLLGIKKTGGSVKSGGKAHNDGVDIQVSGSHHQPILNVDAEENPNKFRDLLSTMLPE
jgi:hypothetical protein